MILYHGSIDKVTEPDLPMIQTEITDKNLYLLLPGKISTLAVRYAEECGVSILDAIKFIYNSNTYRQLSKESTKLWHLGPVALYEYLLENN